MKDIKNQEKPKPKAFSIRVSSEIADWIDRFADENRWSRNVAISVLLENAKHLMSNEEGTHVK